MKKRRVLKRKPPEQSLDDLYYELLLVSQKLTGLASLFGKAATDELGMLDVDEAATGMGEILKDYSGAIRRVASVISEHAVIVEQLRKRTAGARTKKQ